MAKLHVSESKRTHKVATNIQEKKSHNNEFRKPIINCYAVA